MNNFCTLFDSHYLTRGLAMYRSLEATSAEFQMYIYAFDTQCYNILFRMILPRTTIVSLAEFEDEKLLAVKPDRSRGEYCWTCTSHVIGHALKTFGLAEVTYVDADLYFFSNPLPIFEEFGAAKASVLLTEHRYSPYFDKSKLYGKFCVQFMTFLNNENGLSVLNWWQDRCIEWCYATPEDGKFGDQKYLDCWPEKFPGIHVLKHPGGLAPWNIQQHRLEKLDDDDDHLLVDGLPVVFYHFQNYNWYEDGSHWLGNFRLNKRVVDLIYRPYVRALEESMHLVRGVIPSFDAGVSQREKSCGSLFWDFINRLKGNYNIYKAL